MSSERHRYSSSKVHATSFENGHPHRLNVPVLALPPHLLALRLTYWVAGFFSRSDCCCTHNVGSSASIDDENALPTSEKLKPDSLKK